MRAILLIPMLFACVIASTEPSVPLARDFQADGQLARTTQRPLLVIVSSTDCSYCALLNREIIQPALASGDYDDEIIVRELLLDIAASLKDFDGREIDALTFAARYGEWLTPTLLFLGPEGTELTERIRGIGNIDFYGYYLDQAIEKARMTVPQP